MHDGAGQARGEDPAAEPRGMSTSAPDRTESRQGRQVRQVRQERQEKDGFRLPPNPHNPYDRYAQQMTAFSDNFPFDPAQTDSSAAEAEPVVHAEPGHFNESFPFGADASAQAGAANDS